MSWNEVKTKTLIRPKHIYWSVTTIKSLFPMFHHITKTRQYIFDPLKPHFYIINLGFTGVYIIFSYFTKNIDLDGSNEYPQSMFWVEIWKISDFFFIWIISFFGCIFFPIYLNRRVFVMQMILVWCLARLAVREDVMPFSHVESKLSRWQNEKTWCKWCIYVQTDYQCWKIKCNMVLFDKCGSRQTRK